MEGDEQDNELYDNESSVISQEINEQKIFYDSDDSNSDPSTICITLENISFYSDFHNSFSIDSHESILKPEDFDHYLCPNCHIFPFIEFTKSKNFINFTCLCYNNKEILIKDLFDKNKNYITIKNLSD